MNKKLVLILCAVLIAVLFGAGIAYNSLADQVELDTLATQPPTETAAAEASETSDYSAPDFTFLDWEGNTRQLSEFEGKPVILNFWASWCGPCKSEMPDFDAAFAEYGENIHFLMVNVTGGQETVESAKAFIEESGYGFPVYFDTTNEGAYLYGASSIPLTYFIDADGNLVTYARGALSAEMLKKGIGYIYSE